MATTFFAQVLISRCLLSLHLQKVAVRWGCECYNPLFVFNQDGDVGSAKLRPGNVASADDWRSVLEPVIERYRDLDVPKFFRGDAAFAIPALYELLEAEGYRYAVRLKGNPI